MSMTDGAAAPADSAPVSNEPVVAPPNPISTEGNPPEPEPKAEPKPEPKPKEPEPTSRSALERAKAAVEEKAKAEAGKDDQPKDDAKPVKSEAARDETGKFAPKEPAKDAPAATDKPAGGDEAKAATETAQKGVAPAPDAPARFSPDAKAAWSTAPEPVKAEVNRAIREMEAGIEKHRASAEAFEPVRQYHEMAQKSGTTLDKALESYVGIENAWRQNPTHGFVGVCQNMGVDPVQQAKAIYEQLSGATGLPKGDSPDVAGVRSELSATQRELAEIKQTLQQQAQAPVLEKVSAFAADKPLFNYVANDIAQIIADQGVSLEQAYEIALEKHPALKAAQAAPAPSNPEPSPAPVSAPAAQTRAGEKSIAGAPSPGSNPANRQPSSSIKDALKRAAQRAG